MVTHRDSKARRRLNPVVGPLCSAPGGGAACPGWDAVRQVSSGLTIPTTLLRPCDNRQHKMRVRFPDGDRTDREFRGRRRVLEAAAYLEAKLRTVRQPATTLPN